MVGFKGQIAYFVSNDRKALSSCPGSRCFHSGIEGQNIGLESNVLNGSNDIPDFFRELCDLCHGSRHLEHHFVALHDLSTGLLGPGAGLSQYIRCFVHILRNVMYGSCQFLYRTGLFGRTLSQCLGAVRYLGRAGSDLGGTCVDLGEHIAQLVLDAAHGDQQGGKVSNIQLRNPGIDYKIPLSHLAEQIVNILQNGT